MRDNKARYQFDSDSNFPEIGSPFISCVIGTEESGFISLGNTILSSVDGKSKYSDPQFIKGVRVSRGIPNDRFNNLIQGLLNYIRAIDPSQATLSDSEKAIFGPKAEDELKSRKNKYEKNLKDAPKNLEAELEKLALGYQSNSSVSSGIATIELSITCVKNLSLMTYFYNYSVSQNLKPTITVQYGIMGGNGQQIRVSPKYQGIVLKADISNFYDLNLTIQCFPSKSLGWSPSDFNKIFSDKDKTTNKSTKSNNKTSKEVTYNGKKETIKTSIKTNRYSDVVIRIADGLNWNYSYGDNNSTIEETVELPEEVDITVEHFEEGPLMYIQNNFCGFIDQKNDKKGSSKAGAVSVNGFREGYVAYFEWDRKSQKYWFYYVPKRALIKRVVDNIRVYHYDVRGTSDNRFKSEVLEFNVDPVDLGKVRWNVDKRGSTSKYETSNLPTLNNIKKEMFSAGYNSQTKVTSSNASTNNKLSKGSSQNPIGRNILGDNAKYALHAFHADLNAIVANTWSTETHATMKILYDESVSLMQVIYVEVLCPMNDSVNVNGEIVTKRVIHPSSGLYQITDIVDDISEGSATTTLTLLRVQVTQEEVDELNNYSSINADKLRKDKEKIDKASNNRSSEQQASNVEKPKS